MENIGTHAGKHTYRSARANIMTTHNYIDLGSIPSHWDDHPISADGKPEVCHIVTLKRGSKEYNKALEKFRDTLPPSLCRIIEVKRIQNPQLFRQYNTMKADMKQTLPESCQLERELFHGTRKEACDKINHQGFNRTFAGANGTICNCCNLKLIMSLYTSTMITINVTRWL